MRHTHTHIEIHLGISRRFQATPELFSFLIVYLIISLLLFRCLASHPRPFRVEVMLSRRLMVSHSATVTHTPHPQPSPLLIYPSLGNVTHNMSAITCPSTFCSSLHVRTRAKFKELVEHYKNVCEDRWKNVSISKPWLWFKTSSFKLCVLQV